MIRKLALLLLGAQALLAQTGVIQTEIVKKGQIPNFAAIDFRGASGAQPLMNTFNGTLFTDLQTSGLFKMVPKSFYPLQNPQRPEDFRETSGQGLALADWAGSPVNANYLAFGYTTLQNNQLVLFGYVYDVTQKSLSGAQVFFSRYVGSADDAGARSVAHQFAADIIEQFGGGSLIGSHVYFVSDRSGHKEIWQMDYDGQNQKRLTSYGSISTMPAVSPDGSKIAFTSFAKGTPRIILISTATGRPLPFYNQDASMNATPSFTPDGKEIYLFVDGKRTFRANLFRQCGWFQFPPDCRFASHSGGAESEPQGRHTSVCGGSGAPADLSDEPGRRQPGAPHERRRRGR